MSPYGYDYSLAPRTSTGWRSRFATVMTVGAIVAISAISGAAVTLNLLGPGTTADRPATVAAPARPATAAVVQTLTPATPQPAKATVAAVQTQPPPAAAPAPPAPKAAAVEAPPPAHVAESELTFTRGYARRRAIQAAAEAATAVKSDSPKMARVETTGQLGRAATRKPKAIARTTTPQDQRRVAEMREEGGPFSRFEQPERFDFARHQALAFGESRDPRAVRRPPPQGGGLFGNSPSGFFGGLF